MTLNSIPHAELVALAEHVTRLKHDLGKYVRFQGRWLAPDAGLEARVEALEKDLLHTRRGPNGSVDAQTVWSDFSEALMPLRDDHDVAAIFDHMEQLATLVTELAGADEERVHRAEAASDAVAEHIRSLAKRVRVALTQAQRD